MRRDRADVFATLAEGIKGKRAVEWKLVDAVAPRSKFAEAVRERAKRLASLSTADKGARGVELEPLEPEVSADGARYKYVELAIDRARRTATLTMRGPDQRRRRRRRHRRAPAATGGRCAPSASSTTRSCACASTTRTSGSCCSRRAAIASSCSSATPSSKRAATTGSCTRSILHMARVLRRLDMTARSLFAILDPESCFVGSLLELALAADRRYMLDDAKRPVHVQASKLNGKLLPTANGLSRLEMLGIEEELPGLEKKPLDAAEADEAGLVTVLADEIDFDDTLRLAIEERASLSPDALTGMEASFRCRRPGDDDRPRSSAASRPGRTGSSRGPTPPASAARCRCTENRNVPASTGGGPR